MGHAVDVHEQLPMGPLQQGKSEEVHVSVMVDRKTSASPWRGLKRMFERKLCVLCALTMRGRARVDWERTLARRYSTISTSSLLEPTDLSFRIKLRLN